MFIDHEKWNAESIRDLRQRYDESQTEFSRRLRVGSAALATWEQGRGLPGNTVMLVLDLLDCIIRGPTPWPDEMRPPRGKVPICQACGWPVARPRKKMGAAS